MQKIIEIIEYENESHKVDFKKIEYPLGKDSKKNEILKDFSAFANHLSDDDKFIIIGIKENEDKTKETFGIDNPTDEAKYRQFINDNIEPQINFEYNHFHYRNKTICFFKLSDNNNRPYLFSKDCKNTFDTKTEFKYGDGFIRVGTSTKKIGRKEFDDITENKKKYQNRQEDIDIIPIIGKPSDSVMNKWDVKYLDLKLVNKSNKSIDIDVQISLKKSQDYGIILEEDFLREIQQKENQQRKSNLLMSTVNFINPISSNIYINSKENETQFIVELNQIKHKFALTLPQNSVNEDIFLQSIILLEESSNLIEAEVLIRSDDFTKGALTTKLTFET